MRIESSVTSVSWIPSEAIEGLAKLPFSAGITHYDQPPPDVLLGERAFLEGGTRTSTLRAVTRCRVAVVAPGQLDEAAVAAIASGHRREQPTR